MIRAHETEDFVVYDDVLEPTQFDAVWAAVQQEEYLMPHISGWSKVWRMTDGQCIGGRSYEASKGPFSNYVDLMNFMFTQVAKNHPGLVPGWDSLVIRPYLYPRGTKLSWHNDLGYAGSLIAVTASSNRSKGDQDPAEWLPPRTAYRCTYVTEWIAVKWRWRLTIDRTEHASLRVLANACGNPRITLPARAR